MECVHCSVFMWNGFNLMYSCGMCNMQCINVQCLECKVLMWNVSRVTCRKESCHVQEGVVTDRKEFCNVWQASYLMQ